jgi:hypothetical protein
MTIAWWSCRKRARRCNCGPRSRARSCDSQRSWIRPRNRPRGIGGKQRNHQLQRFVRSCLASPGRTGKWEARYPPWEAQYPHAFLLTLPRGLCSLLVWKLVCTNIARARFGAYQLQGNCKETAYQLHTNPEVSGAQALRSFGRLERPVACSGRISGGVCKPKGLLDLPPLAPDKKEQSQAALGKAVCPSLGQAQTEDRRPRLTLPQSERHCQIRGAVGTVALAQKGRKNPAISRAGERHCQMQRVARCLAGTSNRTRICLCPLLRNKPPMPA